MNIPTGIVWSLFFAWLGLFIWCIWAFDRKGKKEKETQAALQTSKEKSAFALLSRLPIDDLEFCRQVCTLDLEAFRSYYELDSYFSESDLRRLVDYKLLDSPHKLAFENLAFHNLRMHPVEMQRLLAAKDPTLVNLANDWMALDSQESNPDWLFDRLLPGLTIVVAVLPFVSIALAWIYHTASMQNSLLVAAIVGFMGAGGRYVWRKESARPFTWGGFLFGFFLVELIASLLLLGG